MNTIKTEAVVLRTRRFSETSVIATLLSRDHGRLDVLAKGARRDKNPLFGHLDLYQREDVVVIRRPGAGLDLLIEAAFVDEHAGLRFLPPAFAAAGFLADLAAEASLPGEPLPEVFNVLAGALDVLSRLGEPAARAGLADASTFTGADRGVLVERTVQLAILDMLAWLGYGLELKRCVLCGKTPPDGEAAALSKRHGGLVCRSCRGRASGGTVNISAAALEALRRRKGLAEKGTAEADLPAGERRNWLRFLTDYCQYAIEKPLKGRKVLFQML